METNSGAPYQIEKALSYHGGGYGRGWIVTHRRSQIGALRTSYADAVRWMDQDAAYRRWDIGHGRWGAHDFDPSTGRCSNCGRSESYVAQAEAEAAR